MDMCGVVGTDAATILENCKHAANRMKQRKFIDTDHWLVKKVAAMKRPRIPARKYFDPKAAAQPVVSEVALMEQAEAAATIKLTENRLAEDASAEEPVPALVN